MNKLKQYSAVISCDFSLYKDMPIALQIHNTFKNRWITRYFQENDIKVIPCVSWSDARSFEYCFQAIEIGSIISISMIGSKHDKKSFMLGYNKMLKLLKPKQVIVYGKPFKEMKGNIISYEYETSRRLR